MSHILCDFFICNNTNMKRTLRETDLRKLFEEYKNECQYSRKLSPETIRGCKNVFTLFLKTMPEVTSIEFLTEAMLQDFFKRIDTRPRTVGIDTIRTGVRKSTIKTYHNKLNAFFVWLCRKGYLEKGENPLENIPRPRVIYNDYKRLSDQDINDLYSSITLNSKNAFVFYRDTMMVSLLFFTGLRLGEFISLKVTDIDRFKKEIHVRPETSKMREPRVIPMHPTLFMHMENYFHARNNCGFTNSSLILSSKEDVGLSRHGLKHWVKALIKKSGVKFHLHRFRHTFACKLTEKNVTPLNLQKLLGHVDIRMTARYTRSLKSEDMSNEIAKISI